MKSKETERPRHSSTVSAVGQLLIAGLIGGFWFVLAEKLAWEAILSAALVALCVVLALAWQQYRADARKRFLAALDAYAEREVRQSVGPKAEHDWLETSADDGTHGYSASGAAIGRETATATEV